MDWQAARQIERQTEARQKEIQASRLTTASTGTDIQTERHKDKYSGRQEV